MRFSAAETLSSDSCLVQVVVVVVGVLYTGEAGEREWVLRRLAGDRPPATSLAWQLLVLVQRGLRCCGINSYTDYGVAGVLGPGRLVSTAHNTKSLV